MWALAQDYTGPDGRTPDPPGFPRARAVEDYGAGRIRPHERTHPGPKEDRLQLTRRHAGQPLPDLLALRRHRTARRGAWRSATATEPLGPDDRRRWDGQPALAGGRPVRPSPRSSERSTPAELLIADGHHRYETARVYAEEIGGEGAHRYVLMCLVALRTPD